MYKIFSKMEKFLVQRIFSHIFHLFITIYYFLKIYESIHCI